jgi:hypothetical protein
MALQLSITTPMGFTADSAYARICSFNGIKTSIQVNVDVYKDKDARVAEMQPIASYSISLPLTFGATMQDMYDALKLDSNFTGAQDV